MKKPVLTKADFVRRYAKGEFGNASPTWDTLEDFLADGDRFANGLFHLRNRVAGGPTYYDIPYKLVEETWHMCGLKPEDIYISAMAPTSNTTFQGEVQQSINHLDLYFTTVNRPMREALATDSRTCSGELAEFLLKKHMDPSSYDWFQQLLILYPMHVIEFSCYSVNWGTIPNRNTVFWEVRKY